MDKMDKMNSMNENLQKYKVGTCRIRAFILYDHKNHRVQII